MGTAMNDLYKVLGVARTASQADIKRAYRTLAKELHPDLHPGETEVAERFKEISAAYNLLHDKDARTLYDRGEIDAHGARRRARFRHAQAAGRAHSAATAGAFEPFFSATAEDLFSTVFGGRRKAKPAAFRARGADRSYPMIISFLEAAKGRKAARHVARRQDGRGRNSPATADGQTIRLKHLGDPGFGGAAPGDALFEISAAPHEFFTLTNNDVHVELPVTLSEAVLGARIRVPTVAGPVTMAIPRHSNTGDKLRLRGKGIRGAKSGAAGDQYVTLKIVLPDKPDERLRRLIAKWVPERDHDVRPPFRPRLGRLCRRAARSSPR